MADSLSLGGTWELSIGGKLMDFVEVPGSLPLMGAYSLSKRFALADGLRNGGRLFICGDGLLCKGVFKLNGKPLGSTGPWVPFRFEIDPAALKEENLLECEISDVSEKFGLSPGRRADSGIVRPISVERRPKAFIENFQLSYELDASLRLVKCDVLATLDGSGSKGLEAVLTEKATGRVVAKGRSAGFCVSLDFDAPRLWSPEDPFLYELSVRTLAKDSDEVSDIVGFRKLEAKGGDFLLNGRRIFLKGVCRHQFIHAFGYAPPERMTRHEMAMIKHFGFNFVRLVHSPHQREAARIAAELGLLVSAESGVCWNDMDDPAVASGGLAALEGLVVRDRNCPSVAAWLLYNESEPKERFIVEGAELCRRLDPGRMVSIADCTRKYDELKRLVEKASLSFIGLNIYAFDSNVYKDAMERFPHVPVVFTEWGGLIGQGNPREMRILCEFFAKHFHEGSPSVAGCCFWAWADYEEYSRGNLASVDGWTVEGLVDRDLKIRPDLLEMSKMFLDIDSPEPRFPAKPELLLKSPPRPGSWTPVPLDGVAPSGQAALERKLASARAHYKVRLPKFSKAMLSGIPFVTRNAYDHVAPLLLGEEGDEVFIPVGRKVSALAILGHAAFLGGYPSNTVNFGFHPGSDTDCEFGSQASSYVFEFKGSSEECNLVHGVDVLRANAMCRKWKSAPVSPKLSLAAQFTANFDFEQHRVYLWEHAFAKPAFLKGIRWKLADKASLQELFAVSVLDA